MLSNLVETDIVSHISDSDAKGESAYLEDESMNQDLVSLIDQFEIKEKIHMEALKYITGYVAYQFKNKYELGIPTKKIDINSVPDWLQTISRGSLLYPNEQLWEVAKTMEEEFYKMHGKSLSKNKSIFHELANQTLSKLKNNSVAFEVILCLSRTHTYIRLRELNRKISFYNNCKKKLDKKMSIPIKTTLDNTTTVQYAGLISSLADKARSVVRDLDPSNDLTFLRIRSKKHEIMVAPDKEFILIVVQNPTD
nr:unnamed protein product [Callosobruchus chinensis]